jgi:hypothetical protein
MTWYSRLMINTSIRVNVMATLDMKLWAGNGIKKLPFKNTGEHTVTYLAHNQMKISISIHWSFYPTLVTISQKDLKGILDYIYARSVKAIR